MSLFTDIQHRTRDDAGCAVWRFSCCNGHPAMRHEGKTKLVRRAIWEDLHGQIAEGEVIRMTCETVNCVHPDHMELTTYRKIAKDCGKQGLMSGKTRSAKIAATKQSKYSTLTKEQVIEIKNSPQTGRHFAKKYCISENLVSKIRTGKTWKDWSNPFMI
jgi:hypothetical protein